jgi:hypothetical protein
VRNLLSLTVSRAVLGIVIAVSVFSAPAAEAQITVRVSEQYAAIEHPLASALPNMPTTKLYRVVSNEQSDEYRVRVLKSVSVQIEMIDDRELGDSKKPALSLSMLKKELVGPALFKLPLAPHGAAVLVQTNRASDLENVQIIRTGIRRKVSTEPMRKLLSAIPESLAEVYKVPKFKIELKPCGVANAFSSPDITICSELTAELFLKELHRAIYVIEAHEIAHSLLRLWDLPGHDNEDIADELATVLVAHTDKAAIAEYIKFLEDQDSVAEAVMQIQSGDRHTISIQRARNMRANLLNLNDISRRWFRILGAHAK